MPYSFVKNPNETNQEYLNSIPDYHPWKGIILQTHKRLEYIDPDYQIAQIKDKFGGLRYYFDTSFTDYADVRQDVMDAIVSYAEWRVMTLD